MNLDLDGSLERPFMEENNNISDYIEDKEVLLDGMEVYETETIEEDRCVWTEEDSWEVLSDGMYEEMPRNPIAYDTALEAMGY
ncbi:MAG: hypothetical protein J5545_03500 [Bacteroidaceae bacterium]|nr:hypothetical protein [Bacteroidaceae bacterium]